MQDGNTTGCTWAGGTFFCCLRKVIILQPIHTLWVYGSARIWLVIHINNKPFSTNFSMNPDFLLVHRNRYSEGMDDGQMTPRGYSNFNSYIKNLHVLVLRMDEQIDGEINPVWAG
jgi:hypothetical protein